MTSTMPLASEGAVHDPVSDTETVIRLSSDLNSPLDDPPTIDKAVLEERDPQSPYELRSYSCFEFQDNT